MAAGRRAEIGADGDNGGPPPGMTMATIRRPDRRRDQQ